jgi:hypothetical protein
MRSRFHLTREQHIPKGSTKVADKHSDAVAYLSNSTRDGRPLLMVFYGKQSQPVANYVYKDNVRREQAIKEWFTSRQKAEAYTAKRHADRKNFVHDYKVGDILHTCWGYDQTNREFFEVTEVKGKFLILRELAQESYRTSYDQGQCSPLPGAYLNKEPIRRLAQEHGIKISECRTAWKSEPKMIAGVKTYGTLSFSDGH